MNKYSKGNMMPMIIGIVVIMAIAGGAFYFMNMNASTIEVESDEMNPALNSETMTDEEASDSADTSMDENVVTFEVDGSNFEFSLNEIEVTEGQTVRIVFNNVEGFHDFVIDEFEVATEQIQEGNSETIEFVADQAGEFEYYCSVGNHREQGMVGTLTVLEAEE